jgi:hypothetical protein
MGEIATDLVSAHKHIRRSTALRLLPYVGSMKLRPAEAPAARREVRRLKQGPPAGG